MSLSAPEDAFLDVNDAHLRVYGNVHADGLKLGQLEIVTTTSTGSTIQFLHQHTAFTTTSNIEVGTTNHDLFVDTENSKVGILTNTPTTALDVNGTVKATAFDGDGALLTGIPSSAINGTLSQWTTVAGPKIHYSDGNVGIGIADPLHTLDVVGDINFTGTLREDGNPFVSTPWTIESGPTALSYTLGNVGVGGTTPSAKLEVTGNAHVSTDLSVGGGFTVDTNTFHVDAANNRVGVGTASPGQKLSIYTGSTNTAALSFDRSSSGNYRTDIYQDSYGADFRVGYGSYTPATVLYLKRMSDGAKRVVIKDRLGIGRDDPSNADLVIKQSGDVNDSSRSSGIRMYRADNDTNSWHFGVSAGSNIDFQYNDNSMGYLGRSNQGLLTFTGQHRNIIRGITPEGINELQGLIVSANTNKYIKINNGVETGSNAITINESIPVVSLSNVVTDKTCFGVISASEDPEERSDAYGNFVTPFEKEKGDTRVFINSVGEGAIWVVNTNGSLESGDYITTSTVKGYGQKQDSEFLANYTVAKITMDCDFDPATQPVQVIKKGEDGENVLDEHGQIQWEDHPTETEKAYKIRYLDADGVETDEASAVHKAAFVGCTYHCG